MNCLTRLVEGLVGGQIEAIVVGNAERLGGSDAEIGEGCTYVQIDSSEIVF